MDKSGGRMKGSRTPGKNRALNGGEAGDELIQTAKKGGVTLVVYNVDDGMVQVVDGNAERRKEGGQDL